jgi:predicted transcriptional regulator
MRDGFASHPAVLPEERREGYPLDPDFPQLRIASDPSHMLEILRAHLRPLPGQNTRILECRPFRFRCRQATARCVLQYTLRLFEPDTGREWDQWVTGLIFAGEGGAQRAWTKLRGAPQGDEIPARWRCFEPVAFIPELDMVVMMFPCDRRLPQLVQVLADGGRAFDPHLLESLGPGQWQVAKRTLEPTRYRTELGAVLRYSVEARDAGSDRLASLRCYVKVYRNDRGRGTWEFLRMWWDRPRRTCGYSLVRPIAYLGMLDALVIDAAPGTSLREILTAGSEPLAAMQTAARAVAAFNQDDLPLERTDTLEDQLDEVRRASAMVQWACPALRAEVIAITEAIGSRIEEAPPGMLHGDLKADHIFIGGARVTLVDTDNIALGDPVRDAAHFCSYVTAGVGLETVPRREARTLAAAFADEYFQHVPASWRRRFPLHYAGALVEVACGIFRHQQPRWLEHAEAAIDEARRVLAGESTLGLEPQPVVLSAEKPRRRSTVARPERSRVPGLLNEPQLALMQILWASGESTVRELTNHLTPSLAPSTVAALLGQLERKGVVIRSLSGRQHRYRAVVGREEIRRDFVEHLATVGEELFEGDMAALVCRLVRVRDVNSKGLARVIELLQEREREIEGVQG